MSEHAPEPWAVRQGTPSGDLLWIDGADNFGILAAFYDEDLDAEANADRVVACVNACEGLSDGVLKKIAAHGGKLGTSEETLTEIWQKVQAFPALLAACGKFLDQLYHKPPWDDAGWLACGQQCHAAIAKAEPKPVDNPKRTP